MSESIDNLILEHLKRFQAGQDRIEGKLDEIVMRLGQLEVGITGIRGEIRARRTQRRRTQCSARRGHEANLTHRAPS